jgi:hypothetical protein
MHPGAQVGSLIEVAISPDHSISNVFLVDSLDYNLLSVSQLCKMGYNCLFTDIGVTCGGRISPGSTERMKDLTKGPWAQ